MIDAKDAKKMREKWKLHKIHEDKLKNWCDDYLNNKIIERSKQGCYCFTFDIKKVPNYCSDTTKVEILTEYLSQNGYTFKKWLLDEKNSLYRVIW